MRILDATAFRLLLAEKFLVVVALPTALNDVFGNPGWLFMLLLWCPGAFFLPVLLLAMRPVQFDSLSTTLASLPFTVLVLASSIFAVFLGTRNNSDAAAWLLLPVAGAAGALLLLAAMRLVLRYRHSGMDGWVAPAAAAALS